MTVKKTILSVLKTLMEENKQHCVTGKKAKRLTKINNICFHAWLVVYISTCLFVILGAP